MGGIRAILCCALSHPLDGYLAGICLSNTEREVLKPVAIPQDLLTMLEFQALRKQWAVRDDRVKLTVLSTGVNPETLKLLCERRIQLFPQETSV